MMTTESERVGAKHRGGTAVRYFAKIDVSLEESSVCVVDGEGRLVREVKVPSEPEALVALFGSLRLAFERIGLEAGPLSQWLHAGLERAGLPVVLIETRHVKHVLGPAQPDPWGGAVGVTMKTAKHDARGIAQLMRLGWFKPVHAKTLLAQDVRALLTARKLLIEKLRGVDKQPARHSARLRLEGGSGRQGRLRGSDPRAGRRPGDARGCGRADAANPRGAA
jgi:transposase